MINNYYQLYIESTLNLARTAAIKFNDIALSINDGLTATYPTLIINRDTPSSWKYYQNMSGVYHTTDTPMTVVSLDDLTTISFDKTVLPNHPQTLQAYQYGTRYYRELLTRYPTQESLILGILYAPNDANFINVAVAAPEGTLLYYPPDYIESTEYTLPQKLQQWLTNYCSTWVNQAYSITDNLYPALMLAQVTLHMVPALINLRLAACKTPEVHTYHIREYLSSNGALDVYLDKLTREQALFLYRNLLYIRNNAGRKEVFDWLVDNILTKRSLPLYEYTVKHNTYVQLPDDYHPTRLAYLPDLYLKRKALNFNDDNQLTALKTLDQMRRQMDSSAIDNESERTYIELGTYQDFQTHTSATTATKVVESLAVDLTDEVPHTLVEVLMTHWMAWSASNKYRAKISLNINGQINPSPLAVKDTLILYQYCIMKASGFDKTYIQQELLQRVLRAPVPTVQEINNLAQSKLLSSAELAYIRAISPASGNLFTVESFYQAAYSVYTASTNQYKFISTFPGIERSAAAELVCARYYEDKVVTLATNKTYSAWLTENNIDLQNYTPKDYFDLAASIFDQVTGLSAHAGLSIKDIQKAMLAVISSLTSYSIQYLSDVLDSRVRLVNNPGLKLAQTTSLSLDEEYVENPIMDVLSESRFVQTQEYVPPYTNNAKWSLNSSSHKVVDFSYIEGVLQTSQNLATRIPVAIPTQTIETTAGPLDSFMLLTDTQKLDLVDIY